MDEYEKGLEAMEAMEAMEASTTPATLGMMAKMSVVFLKSLRAIRDKFQATGARIVALEFHSDKLTRQQQATDERLDALEHRNEHNPA